MSNSTKLWAGAIAGFALSFAGGVASADTISPISYENNTLDVGDSVTIEKTVVIEAAGPSDALIDVHFLFDTSGSMGVEIDAAKAAAADIFTALGGFGDVAAGVGVYSEAARLAPDGAAPGRVINQDLTTDETTATAALNAVSLSVPDGGGDGPENGNTGIELAVENLSWRPGSTRFVVVFGDYEFKSPDIADNASHGIDDFDNVDGNPISSNADTIAAMAAEGVGLIGLDFPGGFNFSASIEALGGTAFASSATTDSIVDNITDGITAGFAEYDSVTVGDLGGGDPFIDVSVVCTGADIGACVGADAIGDYDRTVDRTFTFDVTFKRTAAGDHDFGTFAIVDGGRVATEKDSFGQPGGGTPVVPLPAAGWLLLAGIGGLAAAKRRKKAA